mgnify:CR=1 FL=1
MIDKEKALKESVLFSEFDDSEIKKIASCSEKKLIKMNKYVVKEGETSSQIIILIRGTARVTLQLQGYEMLLSTLQPYAIIGEITFVDNQEISADVIADEPCLILLLQHTDLMKFMKASESFAAKFWHGSAKLLAQRIRKSNEMMRSYFGINKALCDNPEFRKFFSTCYYSPR